METLREKQSTIVAGHNKAISTYYSKSKIVKEETDRKCRLCKQHEEGTDHLASEATTIVTTSLRTNLEAIRGKQSIHPLQKTAVLGTSHTTQEVLQSEP